MNLPAKISSWDDKYPYLFVILRIALGLILAIRGLYYLTSIQPLFYLIKDSSLSKLNLNMPLALFVCWAHIIRRNFYHSRLPDKNICLGTDTHHTGSYIFY